MDTWTLLSQSEVSLEEVSSDPDQRIRPRSAGRGSAIAWLDEDGQVESFPTAGLAVKFSSNGAFKTLVGVPGEAATLHVTDRRVVWVLPDVKPESGLGQSVADLLTMGAAGTLRDAGRWTTGRAGIREKFNLVAQIDYLSLGSVRYYQASMFGSRSILSLIAPTGDPAPMRAQTVETSLARKFDIQALAADIVRRAQKAQLREDLRPLGEKERLAIQSASFQPSGGGFLASFAHSCMSLNALSQKAQGRADPPS